MPSLVEVLSDEDNPFVQKSPVPRDPSRTGDGGSRMTAPTPSTNLTWCEFCKGYYDFDYHFGDLEGGE